MNVSLRIILEKPPANIVFALQKGSGNNYQVVQVQTANGGDLIFDFSVEIKGDKGKDELPDFRGPFVHGPKMGRFIYVDIGTYAKHAGSPVGGRINPFNRHHMANREPAERDRRVANQRSGNGKEGRAKLRHRKALYRLECTNNLV